MSDLAVMEAREKILQLQDEVAKLPPVELPLKNYFARGIYAREILIPKGTILVGKIHKYSQINIVSKGDISVTTDNGVVRVQAPFTIASPAGTKRAGYAHEDTIWTTISHTFETDLDAIEAEIIAESFEAYELFCQAALQLKGEK